MKKLFLIISPYLIFISFFAILFNFKDINKYFKDKMKQGTIAVSDSLKDHKIDLKEKLSNNEVSLESKIYEMDSLLKIENDLNYTLDSIKRSGNLKVIIGSFTNSEKASNLCKKLIDQGFNPDTIRNVSIIRVFAASGYIRSDVDSILNRLIKLGYKPWILDLNK